MKAPPLWIWLATLGLIALFGVTYALEISLAVPTVVAVLVILVIAAPRRVRDLGGPGMGDPPDER